MTLTKGYNKLNSSQASQMRITIDILGKSKKHPILLEAAKYLNQEADNKFYKSYMDRLHYHLSIQLDESIQIEMNQLNNQENLKIKMIGAHVKKLQDIRDNVSMKLFYSINLSQDISM